MSEIVLRKVRMDDCVIWNPIYLGYFKRGGP